MSLFSRLYDAVRSWRRRPEGGPRATKRVGVSMEHLDHRQLLSVNFTGNVATDFPASTKPGVVVLPDNPSVQHPVISDPALAAAVKVSGFDINGLRVTYTAADDTLSVGIAQPLSQQTSHPGPVIAGDSDNNGNDGTVSAAVTALEGPGFKDFPDFGGSEFMGAFLDLKGKNFADVAAGYAVNDPRTPKQFQVAAAIAHASPPANAPDFGTGQVQQPGTVYTEVPAAEGNVYKVNSPAHPNLEFSIAHFSQLYLQETGKILTAQSVLGIGASAGSGDDPGIGEAFFPEQKFTLGQATLTPPTCPPASPPVIINPHANQHINTAHDTLIRVNVLGSSGFDVTKIEANTVTLGGAHPIFSFDRFINKDNWPDATFVFRGTDVHLPSGYTEATVAGNLTNGTSFSSSVRVFNRDASFYPSASVQSAQNRVDARAARGMIVAHNSPVALAGNAIALKTPLTPPNSPNSQLVGSTLKVDYTPTSSTGVVVSQAIRHRSEKPALKVDYVPKTTHAPASTATAVRQTGWRQVQPQPKPAGKVVAIRRSRKLGARLSGRLDQSLNQFVRHVGAVNLSTGAAIGVNPVNTLPVSNSFTPRIKPIATRGQSPLTPAEVRGTGAVNLQTGAPIGPRTSTEHPVHRRVVHHKTKAPAHASVLSPDNVRRAGAVNLNTNTPIGNGAY